MLLPIFAAAQTTTHLSSTVNNGGFETMPLGTGWTTAHNTARNPWHVNTGATPTAGTYCGYISQNLTGTPPPYQYNNNATIKVSHLYRTITVPAGETIIKLNFLWKAGGTPLEDGLRVYVFPNTYTPVSGTPVSGAMLNGTGLAGGAPSYTQLGGTFVGQTAWTASSTFTIPASFAGTSFILDFEWSDSTVGTPTPNPSAAVDNVTLVSYNPLADNCVNAIPLAVTTACNTQTLTNVGATDSVVATGAPAVTCGLGGGYIGQDVWASATVGGDGTLSTTVSSSGVGGMNDPVMAIYSGTCGALTLIQCVDDVIGLFPQINLTGRTPGEVLYIRIWPYGTSTTPSGTFNICATSPSCYTPSVNATTSITSTTATINWSYNVANPANGYEYVVSTTNTTPAGAGTAVPNTTTSVPLTGLTQNTTYYVFVRDNCGGGDYSAWASGSFTTLVTPPGAPTTTGVTICQGGTGSLTVTPNLTLTNITGSWNAATDPTTKRPTTLITSASPCSFDGTLTANYTTTTFTVGTTGTYVFEMTDNAAYDAMGYIVTGAFTYGSCGSGTWIAGDDDTGVAGNEPQITATLTAGVTYTLVSTLFSTSSITLSGSYIWTFTGPGSVYSPMQWYVVAAGGSPIYTGNTFNPVGIVGSGLTDTNTAGTTTYYAACTMYPNIRSAATNFVINPSPASVISGTGSACASTTVSIALSGASPWTFTYTDGTTPVTVTNTSTTPYTFSASPGVATTYTVSALSNAACATTVAAYRTGSASLYVKAWTGATASWATASNWNPSGIPSNTDCVVINNVGVAPIISGTNYYAYANKLTIGSSALLTVNGTNSLTVTNAVGVATAPAGNMILEDDASLVQITNVGSNNNTGNITFKRTASIRRTDYVYWSSPLTSLNASSISPATNPYYIWKWNPSIANSNGGQGNWVAGNEAMVVGKGYIVRAPDLHPTTVTDFTTVVTGVPNNGAITTPLARGTINAPLTGNNGVTITATDDNWNLVGNPYPSSIDAIAFLTQNSNLDGNVRLWTHGTPVGSASSSFYNSYTYGYADSYLTYNSVGPNPPGFGGKIASGQGFFVSVLEGTPTLSVAFNNTMRQYDFINSDFFKSSNTTNTVDRSRIWLSILNEADVNTTTMVGYMDEATLDKDREFDASHKPEGDLNVYSMIGDEPMNIQGRPAFNANDIVPIGYSVSQNGIYKIAIADVDGVFDGDEIGIYLEDTLLNVTHDLRSNYYSFSTQAGTFNDRFKLLYTSSALGTSDNEALNTLSYINNHTLHIQSIRNIEHVDIFDVTGKLIKSVNASDRNFETDFNYPNGVYLLKIKLDNGIYVTKKQLN
ncbi:T9SS type A sorting domain-containing protein [Flavobacterium wongokense]|uniref:T9SS type A sorting domain-containing protein n=1 Tax=Flavobacterium wongokense TaxID=2910674 RepID=UPI001F25787E|nr:T9SS type A sorting domain-containing protein [Flavobacterium sp. WG47]MCF6132725.1 T9SS type A sorting domain-containing protein [Flavobacterium sp. WG47]